MNKKSKQTSGRWTLIALAALFMGPLALASILYLGGVWSPGAGANHGQLLQPVMTLPRDAMPLQEGGATEGGFLLGKWSLVHLIDGSCDRACGESLLMTRQVRLALARYADRTQRVGFTTGAVNIDKSAHPHLLSVRLDNERGKEIAAMLRQVGGAQRIFLVDPLGNLILSYPLEGPPADLRDDLKKLLRVSRIG